MTLSIAGLSLLFSGVTTYFLMQRELLNQAIQGDLDKQSILAAQLNNRFETIGNIGKQIIVDQAVQDFLKQIGQARLRNIRDVTIQLQEYMSLQTSLHSVVLVPTDGEAYWTQLPYDAYDRANLDEPWFKNGWNAAGMPYFSGVHSVFARTQSTGEDVISYIMTIRDINYPLRTIGTMVLNIPANYVREAIMTSLHSEQALLLNERNEQVFGSEMDMDFGKVVSMGSEPTRIDDKYYLTAMLANGWRLVNVVEAEQYRPRTLTMVMYFVVFAVLSLLLIFVSIIPLQLSITRPLQTLGHAMKKVMEGDIDTLAKVRSGDEIEMLSNVFNRMLGEIRSYIDTIIENEEEKRQLQTQLLLEQINPHFIYNTLNTVVYLARQHGDSSIEAMTRSFIQLLRESVRLGEHSLYNTVEREMEMARHYVEIMRYRVQTPFTTKFAVDDRARSRMIPRVILQPLIENALHHGLLPKTDGGTLCVKIEAREGELRIEVADDGVGMESARCSQLFEPVQGQDRMYKIGIYNIKSRLDLLYPGRYQMHVDSEPQRGTRVEISIRDVQEDAGCLHNSVES